MELPTIFGLADNDFHRPEIITERTIVDNEIAPLYMSGNENNYGTTHGLIPEYTIFKNIFRNTLTPKRADRTNIWGSTRNLLLAILDDQPPPCFSIFFWIEMMNMLTHGAQYVIYAPYIQRIINYKTEMKFGYDGRHGAYQPHIIRAPAIPPPSPPAATGGGTFAAAHGSPPTASPTGARAPPARRHALSAAPESSRATTRRGKKQNILVKGLNIVISMCHSNDALIHESHQQMSKRLSRLEERQREISTSMGFEAPEPISYPPLPLPAVKDSWAWYHNANDDGEEDDDDYEIEEESEWRRCFFFSLFGVWWQRGGEKFYLL
jgi:hypothetical protein